MKKTLITLIAVVALTFGATFLLNNQPVLANAASDAIGQGASATGQTGGQNLELSIQSIVNVLLYILGAIAVIMIIIGGIRYTISNGDSSQTKAAKDTILYAVIGLVVAILAYAIVNWVIGAFNK